MRPLFARRRPKKPMPRSTPPDDSTSSLANSTWPLAASYAIAPERIRKTELAVHAAQIEEDVDRQEVLRPRTRDPVGHPRLPGRDRAAPGVVASPSRRPCNRARRPRSGYRRRWPPSAAKYWSSASARIAALEHDGIVLIHRQQALAATGRAQHRHRIGAWRLAVDRPRACAARQSRRPCGSAHQVRAK